MTTEDIERLQKTGQCVVCTEAELDVYADGRLESICDCRFIKDERPVLIRAQVKNFIYFWINEDYVSTIADHT